MEKTLVYILRKFYWNSEDKETYDYKKGLFYDNIYNDRNPLQVKTLPIEECVYLYEILETGKERYTNLVHKLSPYLHLWCYDKVHERREPEFPELVKGPNGGEWAPMKLAITKIATGILEHFVDQEKLDTIDLDEVGTLKFQTGFDHQKRNAKTELILLI